MNKLVELLEAEKPTIPDTNADYDIGYNNGLVMAQAIVLEHDAVPVVRCKDCKHYKPQSKSAHWNSTTPYCCRCTTVKVSTDDFCSYGERRVE